MFNPCGRVVQTPIAYRAETKCEIFPYYSLNPKCAHMKDHIETTLFPKPSNREVGSNPKQRP